MRTPILGLGLIGAAALALSTPAGAWDEIVTARGWQQVDYVEDGDCRAEVRTNGQFYRIAQQGLRPGEEVHFYLANGEVKPVQYRKVANQDGAWREFYIPFLWDRDGGTVFVELQSESCSQRLVFDWARRGLDDSSY
jgi:hypothetical protein